MNLKNDLKGIYSYSFTLSTMFNQYSFKTNKHNLITNEGMNFIFSKLIFIDNEESYYTNSKDIFEEFIDGIILGDVDPNVQSQARPSDTYNTVSRKFELFVSPYIDENNCIVFSSDSSETEVTGDMINGITEIGLITSKHSMENQNNTSLSSNIAQSTQTHNVKLITHDIHEAFENLPTSAKITVEYKLIFDVGNYLKGFTKVSSYENLYEYNFESDIISLKNLDNFYDYSVFEGTLEDMDRLEEGKGKYKQVKTGNTTNLYLRTEDDYSPNGKNIVVYSSIYDYEEEE